MFASVLVSVFRDALSGGFGDVDIVYGMFMYGSCDPSGDG